MSVCEVKTYPVIRFTAVIFAASIVCCAATAAAVQSVAIEYARTLRLPGSTHGIARPVAISYEAGAGETCITDARGPAILLVNRRDVATFQTTRFSALSIPLDACVDAQGSIVFLDQDAQGGLRTIRRLNLHGEPEDFVVERPDRDWTPTHLIICRDGGYLTLDGDAGTLTSHDARTGAVIWHRNVTGDESDTLFLGRPCEGPDGNIYLPGGELHAVLVFDAQGRYLERFGEFGTGPGKMVFPVACAVGPGDTIVVLDRMRHKVMVHDRTHRLLLEYGSIGAGPGQLYHPRDITISEDGRLYVAQGFEGRVQVFQLAVTGRP